MTTTTDPAFVCATDGCQGAEHCAHGLCKGCYQRIRYAGTVEGYRPRLVQLSEALDAVEYLRPRIKVDPATGCWLWTMAKTKAGRSTMTINGKSVYVHRWSYETIGGHEIPEGYEVDHISCPDPSCVNPVHLQALSPERHREITAERRARLKAAGPEYEWVPPTVPRNVLEYAAVVRLDDGRVAPPGAGII